MKNIPLVGRTEEQKVLKKALQSPGAEMVSLIGRRRIGKTFLVKSVYGEQIDFEVTGIQHANRSEQLRNFAIQLSKFSKGTFPYTEPKDWLDAFYLLSNFLGKRNKEKKLVVFLDELPWLATHRSGFLKGLSYFWNSWAVNQHIVIVICGSAASWMIRKVVHHKGGLHNRITRRLALKPFSLAETEAFLKAKRVGLDRYQILHLYMAMGGVPHYLNQVEAGKTAAQNIDDICFAETGLLREEFGQLYSSLFEHHESHIKVIRVLAKKRKGMTRTEIIRLARLPEGGGSSKTLEELLHSGFISKYYPYGKKKKQMLYRLTDEYSLFYLQFVENHRAEGKGIWQQLSQTPIYTSWAGYAFESICLKHLFQIKEALGISSLYTTASSFLKPGSEEEEGLQIDLLIDRNDHAINICEMKFYAGKFSLNKRTALALRNKLVRFKAATRTRKQLFLTLITTFGLAKNTHSLGLVDQVLVMEDLFGE